MKHYDWDDLYNKWKSSGLSINAFKRKYGVLTSCIFAEFHKRESEPDDGIGDFLAVEILEEPQNPSDTTEPEAPTIQNNDYSKSSESGITLTIDGDIAIHLTPGFSRTLLADVIRAVRSC